MNHKFTRQQLYDMVWAEPMSRLATKLGISDVALAKACRRGNVPTPGLGYWAKLQHGKAVERPALPALKAGVRDIILIEPPEHPKRPSFPGLEAKLQAERTAEATIAVTKSLANPHPIVRAWLQHSAGNLPSIERRRLRILSTLFKELEKRGYTASQDPDHPRDEGVKVDDEIIEIRLTERHRQLRTRIEPQQRRFSWEPEWRQELQPTGQLVFRINSWETGFRKEWNDTKRNQLEDQLNDIIAGLILAAAYLRKVRLEREERERLWRAEEEKRRALEEARRKRGEELQGLLRHVEAWRRANDIRQFAQMIATASSEYSNDTANIEQWVKWATDIANEIDPLFKKGLPG